MTSSAVQKAHPDGLEDETNKSRTDTEEEKDTIDFIYRLNGKSGFSAFQRYLERLRSSFVDQLTAVYVVAA